MEIRALRGRKIVCVQSGTETAGPYHEAEKVGSRGNRPPSGLKPFLL
jgi:hypothetical protein